MIGIKIYLRTMRNTIYIIVLNLNAANRIVDANDPPREQLARGVVEQTIRTFLKIDLPPGIRADP